MSERTTSKRCIITGAGTGIGRACVLALVESREIQVFVLIIASTSGSTPRVDWLAYASSKSAVIGISHTLAHELKDYNIKVFNVSPGRCATAMRRSLRPDEDEREIMQPGSVGAIVAFLVRNPECNVDGQDIVVRQI